MNFCPELMVQDRPSRSAYGRDAAAHGRCTELHNLGVVGTRIMSFIFGVYSFFNEPTNLLALRP